MHQRRDCGLDDSSRVVATGPRGSGNLRAQPYIKNIDRWETGLDKLRAGLHTLPHSGPLFPEMTGHPTGHPGLMAAKTQQSRMRNLTAPRLGFDSAIRPGRSPRVCDPTEG